MKTAAPAAVPETLLASHAISFDLPGIVATTGEPNAVLTDAFVEVSAVSAVMPATSAVVPGASSGVAAVPAPLPVASPARPSDSPVVPTSAPPAPQLDLPAATAVEPLLVPPPVPQRVPSAPPPIAATANPPAAPPLDVAPAAAVVDDGAQVKAVLQKYQAAYERLDARLVHSVWPGVNQTMLARAFEGLESQKLTFKACDIQMRGVAASAVCAPMPGATACCARTCCRPCGISRRRSSAGPADRSPPPISGRTASARTSRAGTHPNMFWGGYSDYYGFGTDEFLGLCRQLGAEPMIVLPAPGADPQQVRVRDGLGPLPERSADDGVGPGAGVQRAPRALRRPLLPDRQRADEQRLHAGEYAEIVNLYGSRLRADRARCANRRVRTEALERHDLEPEAHRPRREELRHPRRPQLRVRAREFRDRAAAHRQLPRRSCATMSARRRTRGSRSASSSGTSPAPTIGGPGCMRRAA